MSLLLTGCIDGLSGGSSKKLGDGHDFGDNNPDLVLCMGDSITAGGFSGGAPWPARFAGMSGKSTFNGATPGAISSVGTAQIGSLLAERRPGYVIILYGANDAITGRDPADVGAATRSMIQTAKNASTIPVVATTPPMSGARTIYNDNIDAINSEIRRAARSEGARLVDIHRAIRRNPDLYLIDGLHLSTLGEELVALEFNDLF